MTAHSLSALAGSLQGEGFGGFNEDVSLEQLRRRQSYKWRAYPPDVVPAFVAEMDYPLADPIRGALTEATNRGDAGYAWHNDELIATLVDFTADAFDWRVDPRRVTMLPDVMVGVTEFLRVALQPGDGVVINTPVYTAFFRHILEAGCQIVEVPLTSAADGPRLDLDGIDAAFARGARALLLCSPHNPTGAVPSRSELMGIAEIAARHRALVLADEIHAPLVLDGAGHVPYLSVSDEAREHGVSFVSASKAWNFPGLKCAQVVSASDRMQELVQRMPHDLVFRAGQHGVLASIAAYRDGRAWLAGARDALLRNRERMVELIAEHLPGVRYAPGPATYLAWVDCRALGLQGEPADVFLERGRVALGPGPDYGRDGTGFVRITFATAPAILDEIVTRMRAALN